MSNVAVITEIAHSLAGQDKPVNAQVVLALAKARDVQGLIDYLKRLGGDNV